MPHYKLMYPSEYLNAADLDGKEHRVVIEAVKIEEVPDPNGQKKPKPVMTFKDRKKRMPLPKTCAKVIAAKYGNKTEDWGGKTITIYPTTCLAFGSEFECVRVKA